MEFFIYLYIDKYNVYMVYKRNIFGLNKQHLYIKKKNKASNLRALELFFFFLLSLKQILQLLQLLEGKKKLF